MVLSRGVRMEEKYQQNSLPNCYCGRGILQSGAKYNRIETNYCSTYCRIYKNNGYKRGPYGKPPIPDSCDYCGDEYHIRYELHESNREFCSLECYHQIRRGKRNHIQYTLLRILKHRGKLSAKQIGAFTERFAFRMGVGSVARHMRLFVARGIVKQEGGRNTDIPTRTYELNSDLPIGKIVAEKIRVN